jgi:hypothetical protein
MSNATAKFLSPNLTSEFQPLNQGIIRSVEARYGKKMLTVAEASNTKSDFNKSISVLQAVLWVSSAWEQISREIIVKCFRRVGFKYHEEKSEECEEDTGLN